ncbi:uncharacterized protein LOC116289832 isoform X2 [Actinia tenebrosa]|nr:uncharacterized protein LOC116289832 isoform X2 [Actinia tenebrosa]
MTSRSQEDTPRRKVLLAVDHSEHTLRAFNWYLDDLHKDDSILYILHCQELPALTLPPHAYATRIYEDWLEEARKTEAKNKDLLHSLKQKCESRNVKCELFLEHASSAGDALCQFIKERKPNYVVIGSRGQGMVRRTVLGSVSDFVIHHSAVPVCVCPPEQ